MTNRICPFCKEEKRIYKNGLIPRVGGEKRQRYRCFECGRSFYQEG